MPTRKVTIMNSDSVRSRLTALWLFATLNYLYCDVVTLMDPVRLSRFLAGNVGGMRISQGFLLGASALVEIPIAMVLLSRLLPAGAGWRTNLAAGAVMTAVQLATLLAQPAPYYIFFSVFEIAATSLVTWQAWRWRPGRLAGAQ